MKPLIYVAFWFAVAVGLASCSWAEVQRDSVVYAFKQKCFEANGHWDGFNNTCVPQ